MAAEAGDTSYSELQKFKKSSEPGSVLECWKGLAADLAPRLQEIARRLCIICVRAQFVIAPDLAAVESAQAQLRNELLQSNRDVVLAQLAMVLTSSGPFLAPVQGVMRSKFSRTCAEDIDCVYTTEQSLNG
ncbi:unnamed protein product [Symbiodinium sp. CCMP2592]|nr:unnamed protein product [Symbiodinium sp. CCMP2592]